MDAAVSAAASSSASAAAAEDPSGGALWVFEVPPLYSLRDAVTLAAPVVTGFGRGSKQMGVPTANLDPAALETELSAMRRGVYFGYARLPDDPAHAAWCKCVVNVGQRPTFADGEGVTVEVHALRVGTFFLFYFFPRKRIHDAFTRSFPFCTHPLLFSFIASLKADLRHRRGCLSGGTRN